MSEVLVAEKFARSGGLGRGRRWFILCSGGRLVDELGRRKPWHEYVKMQESS